MTNKQTIPFRSQIKKYRDSKQHIKTKGEMQLPNQMDKSEVSAYTSSQQVEHSRIHTRRMQTCNI